MNDHEQAAVSGRTGAVIYNVPLERADDYHGQAIIVRCDDPAALAAHFAEPDAWHIVCIQLTGLPANVEPLVHWGKEIPVDILLEDPADFPQLYRYAKLLDNHPVRVTLPVVAGFDKAVKLASALQFAIKLEVLQPPAELIGPLARVLDDYLHQSTVSQPVDYFHGLLLALSRRQPIDLWCIQEEDPEEFRYISARGDETLNGRAAGAAIDGDPIDFVARWRQARLAEGGECSRCQYFDCCGGYFKWPDNNYRCDGVKTLFAAVQAAALELRHDLATFENLGEH